jgi:hypothetical protein
MKFQSFATFFLVLGGLAAISPMRSEKDNPGSKEEGKSKEESPTPTEEEEKTPFSD